MSRLPFPLTMAALERIWYLDGEAKHGNSWETREDHVDLNKADKHRHAGRDEEAPMLDLESGELPSEHELLRLMCVNERKRRRMDAD